MSEPKHKKDLELDSLEQVISVVCNREKFLRKIYDDREVKEQDLQYPYPFGLWFRGQCRQHRLIPSIFRTPQIDGKDVQKAWYDESMMIQHFRQRNPSYEETYRIPFDLLCLLQHYHLPTRLLDWTESILIALYFAVGNEQADEVDGQLFALNARRLNSLTRLHDKEKGYICGSESIDVAIRSAMASARGEKDLRYVFQRNRSLDIIEEINQGSEFEKSDIHSFKLWLGGDRRIGPQHNPNLAKLLTSPVAVFPNRLNPRMTSQLSMVLLFGGKRGGPAKASGDEDKPLSSLLHDVRDPEELDGEQNAAKKFLVRFCIPRKRKRKLRDQLRGVGMHEAALFPELDHIGSYVRKEWTFPRNNIN